MLVTLATVVRSNIFPLAQHWDRRLIRKVLRARKVEGETERSSSSRKEAGSSDKQLSSGALLKLKGLGLSGGDHWFSGYRNHIIIFFTESSLFLLTFNYSLSFS